MSNRQKPKVGSPAYTDGWWNDRRDSFGASEAAAVCGVSRYSQPLQVYESKTRANGESNGGTREHHNSALRRGHRFEQAILDWYGERVGGTIFQPPMLIHPEHSFMSATPDALWCADEIGETDWSYSLDYIPVDAKTTQHKSEFGPEGTDDIPQEYVMQAQQQMAVTDAQRCDLPVLFPNYSMCVYTVNRNNDLIGLIVDAEKEMAERIENRDPPEPNWEHPKTYDIIRSIHDVSGGEMHIGGESTDMWIAMEKKQAEVRELEKEIRGVKARVLHEMGDYGVGHLQDGRYLVRKKIKREAREVAASEYITLRCKKG